MSPCSAATYALNWRKEALEKDKSVTSLVLEIGLLIREKLEEIFKPENKI